MKRIGLVVGGGVLLTIVVALLLTGGAEARPPAAGGSIPTDPDFPIWEWIGSNACNEMHPDVAYDEDNDRYLVVFDWDLNGTDDHDVMGMYVSADGVLIGWVFSIADGSSDDSHPAVARDPYGNNFLVVWQRKNASGNYDIWGRLIGAGGGSEFPIATWLGDQVYPDLAYATASSSYLVAWEDHWPNWTNQPDIYGAIVDSTGSVLQYSTVTGLNAVGEQTRPAVAVNAFDYRWLVVWRDSRNSGTTNDDIYGRTMVFSSGVFTPSGDPFPIGTLPWWAGSPAVAWGRKLPSMSAYGEFLVTWPETGTLWAQRVDGFNYNLVGSPIVVSDFDSGKSNPAVLFATEQEEWWVVWEDDREYG